MTAWTPDWQITIAGVDYTSVTIANLKINAGRTSIDQQPVASYANVEVINLDKSAITVEIGNNLSIAVKDSTNNYVTIFGGTITDLSIGVTSAGSVGIAQSILLTALGSLSKLPKALTTGVLSRDEDGDQIYTILSQLLLNSWNEVAPALTWNTYSGSTTWANAEDLGLGEIDRPGQYELTDRSSSTTDIYSLVSALANSGLGYIYENAQGEICYADAVHRQNYRAANGFVEISANSAIGRGITIQKQSATVKNSVTIKYKNNLEETATDTTSIATFGLLSQIITTSLHNQIDASAQATRYLNLRSYPRFQLNSLTYPIQNPEISNGQRDDLLGIFIGMPIKITDLPSNMLGGEFTGYIEGWTWNASVNGLWLNFYATPTEFSEVSPKWSQVNAAEAWNTISLTLEWQDAIGAIT